ARRAALSAASDAAARAVSRVASRCASVGDGVCVGGWPVARAVPKSNSRSAGADDSAVAVRDESLRGLIEPTDSVSWCRRRRRGSAGARRRCGGGCRRLRLLCDPDRNHRIVNDRIVEVGGGHAGGAALRLGLLLLSLRGLLPQVNRAGLADEVIAAVAHPEPRLARAPRRG